MMVNQGSILIFTTFILAGLLTYFLARLSKMSGRIGGALTGLFSVIFVYLFFHVYSLPGVQNLMFLLIGLVYVSSLFLLVSKETPPIQYLLFSGAAGSTFAFINGLDFITAFIFLELSTVFVFLSIVSGDRKKGGFLYLLFNGTGGLLFLYLLYFIYMKTGRFDYSAIAFLKPDEKILALTIGFLTFAIKMGTMPFHIWQPYAYRDADNGITVFLSGAISKIGVFGAFLMVFLQGSSFRISGNVYAYLGVITAVLAGLYALLQEDAKRLLAYSSLSQLGYVVIGLGLANSLSISGAVLHAVSHGIFESLLFLVVGAVYIRTKTTDLNKLGGLITYMPVSFIGLLLGIIAASGIPPTIGFPSKWMLYHALVINGDPVLLSLTFLASILAFLYSFRLVYSIFLGPYTLKEKVGEAPFPALAGMVFFLLPLLILGLWPGLVLKFIELPVVRFGLPDFSFTPATLKTPLATVNFLTVGVVFIAWFVVAILVYAFAGRSRWVPVKNNYTAAEAIEDERILHYTGDFYRFIRRDMNFLLRHSIQRFYRRLFNLFGVIGDGISRIYTGDVRTYVYFVLLFILIVLFKIKGGFPCLW